MRLIHYLLFIPPTLLGGWYLGSKLGASFHLKDSSTRKKFIFWSIILVFFTINVCLLTPAAVIFLYTVMFYLIYDLTIWIAKKANAKSLIKFIKRISMGGVTFILLATTYTLYGVYKAKSPVITNYTISVNKEIKNNGLTIMLLSDLHLGTGSNCNTIDYIVDQVNKANADIFLIDGDLFDESTKEEYKTCAYENLGTADTTYGTYYVEGNHDLLNDESRKKFNENNIRTLEDEVLMIDDSFYLVGRKDKDHVRLSLDELMTGIDHDYPIILFDHRPEDEEQAKNLGVDLQVAGHTHAGQLFPGNLFVQSGFKKDGDYHLIISSGFGTWGTAIRTSKSDELVEIFMQGKTQ